MSSTARLSRPLALVLGLGLLVRIVSYVVTSDPFDGRPILDAAFYDEWAKQLASGGSPAPVFWVDPLYAYLLALVYHFLGDEPSRVLLLQTFADAVHVAIVAAIAHEAFRDRRVTAIAALLAAFYEPYLFFDGLRIKATLSVFVFDLALWLGARAVRRRTPRAGFAFGAALGLAALSRPNVLGVALAFFAAGLSLEREKKTGARRVAWIALAGVGALIAISPATIHNLRGGEFVLISANGGANFYLGNNPENPRSGLVLSPSEVQQNPLTEEEEWTKVAERHLGHPVTANERESYWLDRGLTFCKAEPRLFLRRVGHRALLIVNAYEVPDDADLEFYRGFTPWFLRGPFPLVTFGSLFPLALAALLGAKLTPERRFLMLAASVYALTVIPFVVYDRHRVLLAGPLFPFAAFALVKGVEIARRPVPPLERWVSPGRALAGLALGVVLVSLPVVDPRPFLAQDNYRLAHLRLEQKRVEEVLPLADRALEVDPSLTQAALEKGLALVELRRDDEALAAFDRATQGRSDIAGLALVAGGELLARHGRLDDARKALEKALPLVEWNPAAHKRAQALLAKLK